MRTSYECIPCIINQAINTVKRVTNKEKIILKVAKKMLDYLINADFRKPPAVLSLFAYRIAEKITKCKDPYLKEKKEYNDIALKMYPDLKKFILNSKDKIHTALKISAVGNVIDLGIGHKFDLKKNINEILKDGFKIDDFSKFKKDLRKTKKILFVGDNAGEIVFDKIFLEELKNYSLIYVVKEGPIINDATKDDALYVGLEKVAKIMTTGTNAVGAPLDMVSKEFLKEYNEADIIIAKGHGNYETLIGGKRKCYFILKAKCDLVANHIGVKKGDIVFIKR